MSIESLFKIDLFLYRVLLTPQIISNNIAFRASRRELKKVEALKELPRTETVYICGNGPSLSKADMRDIRDDYIVVNDFYKFTKKDPAHPPKYYMVIDEDFLRPDMKERYDGIFNCGFDTTYILTGKMYDRVRADYPSLGSVYYCCPWGRLYRHTKKQDFTKVVSRTWNVVSEAILFAIYLGYTDIRLLGCDYSVFANDAHFYPQIQERVRLREMLYRYCFTTEAHYEIEKYAEATGVKITNMTRATLLDAYPIDENSPY